MRPLHAACSQLVAGTLCCVGIFHPAIGWSEEPATPAPAASDYVSPVTSQDAAAHLNYASILFYKAGAMLSQDPQSGQRLFREVGDELQMAMTLSESAPNDMSRSLLRSQAEFLLGELAFHVLHNREQAKQYYQASLKDFANHAGAAAALIKLEAAP